MDPGARAAPLSVFDPVVSVLNVRTWRAINEEDLHGQIEIVLRATPGLTTGREVRTKHSRYDLLVDCDGHRIVVEIKVTGSPGAVTAQVQRYAQAPDVTAVLLVTTSSRLARAVSVGGYTLAGKPFRALALRTF